MSRLPPEIRELVGKLRTERGCTIDEIHAKLMELDVEIGRSSVGRAVQKIDAIAATIEKSRAAAEAIMDRLGDRESRVARLNIELMHGLLLKLMTDEESGGEVKLDAREAMFVSTSLQKLAAASKTDADRELRLRKELAGRLETVEQEAADAGEKGLSAERVAQLRRDFLGVRSAGAA